MNRIEAAAIVRREMEPVSESLREARDLADARYSADLQKFRDQRDHGDDAPRLDCVPRWRDYRVPVLRRAIDGLEPLQVGMRQEPQVQKALEVLGRRRERQSHKGGFSQDIYDIANCINSISRNQFLGQNYMYHGIRNSSSEKFSYHHHGKILAENGLIVKQGRKYILTEKGKVAAIILGELLEFCEAYDVSFQRLLGQNTFDKLDSVGAGANLNIFNVLVENYPHEVTLDDFEQAGIDRSVAFVRCTEFDANGFVNYRALTKDARTKIYRTNDRIPEFSEGLFSDRIKWRQILERAYPFIVQSKGDITKQMVIDWLLVTYPDYKTIKPKSIDTQVISCLSILRAKGILVATKENTSATVGLDEQQHQMISDFLDIFSGVDLYMMRGITEKDEISLYDTVGNATIWSQILTRERKSGFGSNLKQKEDVKAAIAFGVEAHKEGVGVLEFYKWLIREWGFDMNLNTLRKVINFHQLGVIENGIIYPKGTVTPGPLKRD